MFDHSSIIEKIFEFFELLINRDELTLIAQRSEEELKVISDSIAQGEERFTFIVDLVNKKIIHPLGVTETLGIPLQNFTLKSYVASIHPQYLQQLFFMASTTFDLAHEDEFYLTFDKKYIIQVPIKNQKGEYLYCKRTLSPFSISREKNGRAVVTSYLNDFMIISEFDEEKDMNGMAAPRIIEGRTRAPELESILISKTKELFEEKSTTNPFSTQEIRILKRYAQNDASANDIAKAFKIEKNTVYTLNRRILEKTEKVYQVKFDKASDVAKYLKKEGLL
jgi:predicted DNA-binding protein YlxM (UPF0122 family)